jgi:hypothetical protein
MRYAPLRSRKNSPSAPASRPGSRPRPAVSDPMGQTVGDRLKAKAGPEYGSAWLARALDCSPDTAVELDGYWLPQGPPHLLEQTIGVFAKALDLDAQRLLSLILSPPAPQRAAPPPATAAPRSPAPREHRSAETEPSVARRRSDPAAAAPAPRQAEISIGSADGVRVIKQQQPTIVYRKTRKFVEQTS